MGQFYYLSWNSPQSSFYPASKWRSLRAPTLSTGTFISFVRESLIVFTILRAGRKLPSIKARELARHSLTGSTLFTRWELEIKWCALECFFYVLKVCRLFQYRNCFLNLLLFAIAKTEDLRLFVMKVHKFSFGNDFVLLFSTFKFITSF